MKEDIKTSIKTDRISLSKNNLFPEKFSSMKPIYLYDKYYVSKGNLTVWLMVGLVEFLLTMRLIYLLFDINQNAFFDSIVQMTNFLVYFGEKITYFIPIDSFWSSINVLISMTVYILAGLILTFIINLLTKPRPRV